MSEIKGMVDLVQDAIDNGARSVEEVHRDIANRPFEILKKVLPEAIPLDQIQQFQNQTIGGVYDAIRMVNQKSAEIARDLLAKVEGPSSGSGRAQ